MQEISKVVLEKGKCPLETLRKQNLPQRREVPENHNAIDHSAGRREKNQRPLEMTFHQEQNVRKPDLRAALERRIYQEDGLSLHSGKVLSAYETDRLIREETDRLIREGTDRPIREETDHLIRDETDRLIREEQGRQYFGKSKEEVLHLGKAFHIGIVAEASREIVKQTKRRWCAHLQELENNSKFHVRDLTVTRLHRGKVTVLAAGDRIKGTPAEGASLNR